MHAGPARLVVVVEMSRADSLSDAVSQRVHFGITHPEYQLTKAPGCSQGAAPTQKQQLSPNAHKCRVSLCVAFVTCLCMRKFGCGLQTAPTVFLEGVQPWLSSGPLACSRFLSYPSIYSVFKIFFTTVPVQYFLLQHFLFKYPTVHNSMSILMAQVDTINVLCGCRKRVGFFFLTFFNITSNQVYLGG